MCGILSSAIECIGNTPMVELSRLNTGVARLIAKVEFFNPGGSVKDRVGLALIEDAENRGILKKGALIVEPTSGNTGIGLALAAAIKGYRLMLTMPDTMSIERRKLLAAYGAELVLTPGALGMQGAIDKAEEIVSATPGAFMPQQFENPANPECHRKNTAQEILRDTKGDVDVFVAGVGTGGTLTGIGEELKSCNPNCHIVAVEPADSPLLSQGKYGVHKLQGIGANFIPKVLNTKIIDEIFTVTSEQAGEIARASAKSEGLLIGISGGAALYAALAIAKRPEMAEKNIVVLLPDTGERYLSSWLF